MTKPNRKKAEGEKITDEHFIDWESETFGYGYGTGEQYTLKALKIFLSLIEEDGSYSYEVMEKGLSPIVAWLMINILCRVDILEYGTSPRFGWLTPAGVLLKEFVGVRSLDGLYDLTFTDENYIPCYKSHCNCAEPCNNSLFV